MNPIAEELNQVLMNQGLHLYGMLSEVGKNLFFPKGILTQSAEAKQKAHRINATIGMATEKGHTMCFPSVMDTITGLAPEESLTYAPSFGIPGLRKAWQEALIEKNPSLNGHPVSLPVVTCGITHALSVFADVWVNPDDVIVMPDMLWGNYNMIFKVRKGASTRHFPIFTEDGGYNIEGLESTLMSVVEERKKAILLLNFPHNPTGYSIRKNEADELVAVLDRVLDAGGNLIVVCDDAYFGLFYEEDVLKESFFAKICGRHPRLLAVKLDGATKEHYVWGLRVGFITYGARLGNDDYAQIYDVLERKTAGCVRGNISNASHLSQSIILKSMADTRNASEQAEKLDIMTRRAASVKKIATSPEYADTFTMYPFNAGYFMCIRLKDGVNAETVRQRLLDAYGVGLISMGESDLRVAFSCVEEEDVKVLFDTIQKGVKDIYG